LQGRAGLIALIPACNGPPRSMIRGARHLAWPLVFAAILSVIGAMPLAAAPLPLPPIVDPPAQEHHVGKLILAELVTPDLAAAKKFYGGLLGWTFRDSQSGRTAYAEALLNGRSVAGIIQRSMPAGEKREPAWLSFFAVKDVDATEQTAVQNGAKVLFGPHSFPLRGREAVLADPQGAVFAILASSSGDPPDVLVDPGEWIWSSLITTDAATDAAFYQIMFNYEVFEQPGREGSMHLLLASDNYARASANTLRANRTDVVPHWINFVRVDDVTQAAAKVVALGGQVLVTPRADRQGGRIAVVADPAGANFGLMEWQAAGTKEVSK
jgi:predicted enzyme related to lactoylglutathione lyase